MKMIPTIPKFKMRGGLDRMMRIHQNIAMKGFDQMKGGMHRMMRIQQNIRTKGFDQMKKVPQRLKLRQGLDQVKMIQQKLKIRKGLDQINKLQQKLKLQMKGFDQVKFIQNIKIDRDTLTCGGGESMYWKRFVNKILVASRTGIACLIIGALITYVPTKALLSKMLAFTTYAPTIAISACDVTLGKVMSNIWAIVQVALFVMLETMLIMQFLRPPMHAVHMVACIGVSSFLVTCSKRVNMTGKKVGLAQICMTFIAAHLDPDLDVVWMPIRFMASIFVGAGAALLALIFPYPQLATMEVQRLSKSAVSSTSDMLQTVASAFCAADASTSYSICLHSRVLSQAASEVIAELQVKQREIEWEVRACFANSIPRFAKLSEGLEKLHLHLAGMELALRSHYLLQSSSLLRNILEVPLMRVVQSSMALLDRAGKVPLCSTDVTDCTELTKEGKEALSLFDEALFIARTKAFYSDKTREPPVMMGPLTTTRSMATLSLDEILKRPNIEAIRGVDGLNAIQGGPIEVTDIVSPTKRAFMSRVTTYFFLFNLRLYIEDVMTLVDANWKNPIIPTDKVPPIADRDWRPGLELRVDDIETGTGTTEAPDKTRPSQNTESVDLPQPLPSPSRCPRPVQCTQCAIPTIPVPKLNKACLWKFLKGVQPTKGQICKALKISLAMMLSTILGMLVLPNDSHCAWAPVTVAIFLGNHQGGSFRLALLRIQGTVLGSIYGYLVVSATHQNGYWLLFALTIWVTASDYIRYSKNYGYSEIVSAQTAATMMLGDYPGEVKVFALDRVTETFVGVMCFVFVEAVLFPERAVILAKREMIHSLKGLRNCVVSVCTAYTGGKCQSCRRHALEDIRNLEQGLRASLARQAMLCGEAATEPDLWFVPFPGDVFSRLIAVQGRMLNPLCFMRFSLQATVEETLDEHMQILLKPLQASLMDLEEQVVSAINFLSALFIKPAVSTPLENFVKWFLPPCMRSRRYKERMAAIKAARSRKTNTPLQMLGGRRRSVAGTPLHLKTSQKHFEKDFEIMLDEIVQRSKAGGIVVSNSVMLSLSSLSFCLHEIMKETVELEKTVYELLQAERPWSILDHWDSDIPSKEVWREKHQQQRQKQQQQQTDPNKSATT